MIIAYLEGNFIQKEELFYLQRFKILRKLDISDNGLKVLPESNAFKELVSLEIFYLHNNYIERWDDIKSLCYIPNVKHLTLQNNPCT